MSVVYSGSWTAGYLLCAQCAKDPDPRGWTACASCRALNGMPPLDSVSAPDFYAQIAALRTELASYRALPLVPIKEYERVCDQRDEYAKLADSIAGTQSEATTAQLQRTLVVMSRVGKMLSKHAPAADEREAFAEFFALLAEHGCHPGQAEQERLEIHFAEWEARKR